MITKTDMDLYTYTRPLQGKTHFWSSFMRGLRALPQTTYTPYTRTPYHHYHDYIYDTDSYSYPATSLLRDPWWYDYPTLSSMTLPYIRSRPALRHSYLSPVKKHYVWTSHPARINSYLHYSYW